MAGEENVSWGRKNDLPPQVLTHHWLIAALMTSICAPRYHFQPLNLSSLTLTATFHNVDTLTQLFSLLPYLDFFIIGLLSPETLATMLPFQNKATTYYIFTLIITYSTVCELRCVFGTVAF